MRLTSPVDDRTYSSVNRLVLQNVPREARRVLDVGCGTGQLGQVLKAERPETTVVGITWSAMEAEAARAALDEVFVEDLESASFDNLGTFDCVICSHVLEHLRRPGDTLKRLRRVLSDTGTLVVALPNPMVWRQRLEFLRGRFRYTPGGGIMDDTHLVFFDWDTAQDLVSSSGFDVVLAQGEGGLAGSRHLGRLSPTLRQKVDDVAVRVLPGLFATQIVMVGRPVV